MTTGIYTTKWFLQCFIDRVRMLWGFFAALLFACMVNLPVFFCKYHTLKKMLIIYKVGCYAHSHKAKKLIREKLKITACHWWQANSCCLITSNCREMAQHQQYKLQSRERSFSCPLALLQRQLTSLWLWKQYRKKKSWGHKPQQIAVQQLQAKEHIGTEDMLKCEKITLICPELIE